VCYVLALAFIDGPRVESDAVIQLGGYLREGITFEDVSFTYPGSVSPALSRVSLTIRAGERIVLVSENDAGKSTLVKLLLGLYRPTGGRIQVDGMDPSAATARVGATWVASTRAAPEPVLHRNL